ncbi:cutinase family protein [Streptomyces europaeiscabiei]|uniref:Cutinase family protein n=1 Tax=Streptomyces europaeiscabiei TaxID=146819 RepID=A0ABU4NM76_9ACTN|nr:cutinase family protein [Streptomyces europaeiscabiei]MDX2772687.1 cutinase family protein [Streptomyces europaeiscabiei]MDX3546540.1 cutinase family protein [Streptomyces europaeiscabiei]MDX3556234.1 cutinase family protein [Streptomyces europaeiscabiei]MDX3670274.1 cutinase family protein [Streptomyces europaeiscabiei]MDX3703796.1 cutinase family protein [Streptomyces europaeiscabiei]
MRIRLCLAALSLAGGAGLATVSSPTATAAACTDIDVVAARGTFEPGTLGFIVGDPVYSALQKKITGKSLSSYKVNYPADLSLTSAAQGNTDLVNHVRSQAASCPNQRFILVGYSQGANVVDNSIGISSAGAVVGSPIVATIPATLEPRVSAVLLFGNPIRAIGKSVTGTYQSRTIDFCAAGDPVCENGGGDVGAHLGYRANADAAAAFAATKI